MGELRDRMVREMDVRHFSGRTVEAYVTRRCNALAERLLGELGQPQCGASLRILELLPPQPPDTS